MSLNTHDNRGTLSKHMGRRVNKECKRRRTVKVSLLILIFFATNTSSHPQKQKQMDNEDLEHTYNRMHYDACEISKKLRAGPGDGKKLNDYVFNNILSARAIQKKIDSKF